MPKYNIEVQAEIEITAPNVAKAYAIAQEQIKIIGQHVGSRRDKHDRDMWDTELKVLDVVCGMPLKVATNKRITGPCKVQNGL